MKLIKPLLHSAMASLLLGSTLLHAADASAANLSALKAKLETRLGGPIESVQTTPVQGLYELSAGSMVLYATEDANYLLQGNLIDIQSGENLTENRLNEKRQALLAPYLKDTIAYKADNERYVVTVFTDTTCGYCQVMHEQLRSYTQTDPNTGKEVTLPGYNDLGITIQYLAYPRHGIGSPTFKTAEQVWCADDPAAALTTAKRGGEIANKAECKANIVEQYTLGKKVGLRGTPAMILEDGTMLPGYRNPQDLLKLLSQG